MRKVIAIFRTGGIGDVILSTVSINIIRSEIKEAKIIWFGRKAANELISSVFSDVDVYEIPASNTYKQNLDLIKNSSPEIHAIVDLQHSARTIILGRLAALHFKCKYTSWNKYSVERSLLVAQSFIRGRKLKFDLFKKELPNRYEAMALCTINALNKMGAGKINYQGQGPNFSFYSSNERSVSVAIGLGAKFQTKGLPLTHLEKVLENILAYTEVRSIHLLGEENQKQNAEELKKKFEARLELNNFCGETNLAEAASILSKSKFAIVNDSGLAHLAEAVNTPVLTFFGPTHQKFGYRPHLKSSRVVSVDIGCRPCNKNGDVTCRYNDHACSSFITDEELVKHILELNNA